MKRLLVTAFITILLSCNKEEIEQASLNEKTKEILICGTGWKNNGVVPTLWINKNSFNYETDGNYGRADDMEIVGNDIYTVGYIYNIDGISQRHVIWKNLKVITELTNIGFPFTYSIAVNKNNNDIFVVGSEQLPGEWAKAKIWKNGVSTQLSNINGTLAFDIKINKNNVYVAGCLPILNIDTAVIWTNGIPTFLTDGTNDAVATSIKIVDNDIYVAGTEKNSNGNRIAKYWKNGVATNLTDGSNDADVKIIEINENNIYVGGCEKNSNGKFVAKYWKNGVQTILNNNGQYSAVNSLAILNNIVYATGSDGYDATLWQNGYKYFSPVNCSFRKIIIK